MSRETVLSEIRETLGDVPGWLDGIPDPQLEYQWGMIRWSLGDSDLTAEQKALVAFGAASAVHCLY